LAVVDIHTHVVPNSLAVLPARHRLWPTLEMHEAGRAALMIDGKPFREIDARSWDVERRMHDMAADGSASSKQSRSNRPSSSMMR